jgi:Tol biopolymer transport system component
MPNWTVRRRVALGCAVGALLVAVGVTGALATGPGRNGSIAFRRYLDAKQTHAALLTVAPDGSGERQITTPPAHTQDDLPDWSPDGRRLVFTRCPPDNVCRLMIVNADGSGLRALTHSCATSPGPSGLPRGCEDAANPSFTPDGAHVLFTRATGHVRTFPKLHTDQIENSAIAMIGSDGRGERAVLRLHAYSGDANSPLLSPDGRTIVFEEGTSPLSHPRLSHAIFTVGVDGKGLHRVTPWKLRAGDGPDWAPDGSRILFRSNEDVGDFAKSQIYTIEPSGSGLTQVTHVAAGTKLLSSSFSPDGTRIVFAMAPKGRLPDLYTMAVDGSDVVQLISAPQWDSRPDWGPQPTS